MREARRSVLVTTRRRVRHLLTWPLRRPRLGIAGLLLFVITSATMPVHTAAADPITQTIADDLLSAFTTWVAKGATWVLGQVVQLVQAGTAVDLSGAWFQNHYKTMIALGSLVMVPMLLAACIKAAFSGRPGLAIMAGFVYVPIAFWGTFVGIFIVNELLKVIDWMCAAVSTSLNSDYSAFATNISTALNGGNSNSIAAPFVIFICAVFMVIFGLLVFIELLFRNAAIYATAVFIPLAMATIVFPRTATIAKRLIETIFGLIILKFFIVAVLSIGVAALGSTSSGGSFGTVLAGIVVLILAAVLPNLLIGLLPLVEGAAIATIAARTTTQQVVQAQSSQQIYAGIRRNNEARYSTGGTASRAAGIATAAAGGAGIIGAAGAGHLHPPAAGGGMPAVSSAGAGGAVAGVSGAVAGGGIASLPGGGTTSLPGAGAVGAVFGGDAAGGGIGAGSPPAGGVGGITGLSARRVGGINATPAGSPPAAKTGT